MLNKHLINTVSTHDDSMMFGFLLILQRHQDVTDLADGLTQMVWVPPNSETLNVAREMRFQSQDPKNNYCNNPLHAKPLDLADRSQFSSKVSH